MDKLMHACLSCSFEVRLESAVAGRAWLLGHPVRKNVLAEGTLLVVVEQLGLEAGKGMVEDLHQRDVDLVHQRGTVCLQDVEERVEHVFLDESRKEMVVEVGVVGTVGNLHEIPYEENHEFHELKMCP
jgi:hypothetical protein